MKMANTNLIIYKSIRQTMYANGETLKTNKYQFGILFKKN